MDLVFSLFLPNLKTLLLLVLLVAGLFFTFIGFFVMFHILRPQKSPADESNRINKIRLFWFAMTREELFVDALPWLKNDEFDNVGTGK